MKASKTYPTDKQAIKTALIATFQGKSWSDGEVEKAAESVASDTFTGTGYCWSVGTSGSIHFREGFTQTKEQAESVSQATFSSLLASNPAIGSLPTQVYQETQPQRSRRLEGQMAAQLNNR